MVEECFRVPMNQTGLDRCRAHSYTAWHRRITLSVPALAFLAVLRAETRKGIQSPAKIGPSFPWP